MDWLHAVKGYTRWAKAKATGKVRPERDQARIARLCAVCPSLNRRKVIAGGRRLGFCGPPLDDNAEAVLPTCGCIVLAESEPALAHVTIDGVPLRAAGKPEVPSESCPQGYWAALSPACEGPLTAPEPGNVEVADNPLRVHVQV